MALSNKQKKIDIRDHFYDVYNAKRDKDPNYIDVPIDMNVFWADQKRYDTIIKNELLKRSPEMREKIKERMNAVEDMTDEEKFKYVYKMLKNMNNKKVEL